MQEYILVAYRQGEPDRQCVLRGEKFIIGRAPEADLVLPDAAISRHHAYVQFTGEQVFIEDQHSTNGIYINGLKVNCSELCEGDYLAIGPYTVVLRFLGQTGEEALPKGKTYCIGPEDAKRIHEAFKEKQRSEYSAALYKASLLLGERLPLEELFQQVLNLVIQSLDARRGGMVIQTNELGEFPRLAAQYSSDDLMPNELPLSRTLTNYVLQTKSALLTEDAAADPRFAKSDSVIRRRIGSAMCAPLTGSDRVVGAIYVDISSQKAKFTLKELEFLSAVGHVVGTVVENKLLEDAAARQERLAALGNAIAGVSHDLKNILAGIRGGLELLEEARESLQPDKVESSWRITERAAGHLEEYLGDLLMFAKGTELQRRPTQIAAIVQDVVDLARQRAQSRGVRIGYDAIDVEPVNIDGAQMHRVLLNIVYNAIDACTGDDNIVTVLLGPEVGGVCVRVSDTGSGISPEHIPHLSEPFFSTKGSSGTGLGLAISYRIVEQHGGRIRVASELGHGSTFTVFLPAGATQTNRVVPKPKKENGGKG